MRSPWNRNLKNDGKFLPGPIIEKFDQPSENALSGRLCTLSNRSILVIAVSWGLP